MIQLTKIKYDKKTQEESVVPLFLYKDDIVCLYKDRKGVFIVTNQGTMHKVPYKIKELEEYLEM